MSEIDTDTDTWQAFVEAEKEKRKQIPRRNIDKEYYIANKGKVTKRHLEYNIRNKVIIEENRKKRRALRSDSKKEKDKEKARKYYHAHKKPTKVKPEPEEDLLSGPLLEKLTKEIEEEGKVLLEKRKQANKLRAMIKGRIERAKLIAEGKSTYTPQLAIAIKKYQAKEKVTKAQLKNNIQNIL